MRTIYTDGFNSAAHVALGYIGGSSLLVPFLVYQLVLQGRPNDVVDVAEYLSGWLLRNGMHVQSAADSRNVLSDARLSAGANGSWQRVPDVFHTRR